MQSLNHNVTIHPCAFDSKPCENYLCRQSIGVKKFYIGNEQGHGTKPIFCEDCIKNLVHSLPAELYETGEELETRLREELEAEYEQKFEEFKVSTTTSLEESITARIQIDLASQEVLTEESEDEEVVTQEEEKEVVAAYRCLECGEEFDTPQKLGAHKRKHKED